MNTLKIKQNENKTEKCVFGQKYFFSTFANNLTPNTIIKNATQQNKTQHNKIMRRGFSVVLILDLSFIL